MQFLVSEICNTLTALWKELCIDHLERFLIHNAGRTLL